MAFGKLIKLVFIFVRKYTFISFKRGMNRTLPAAIKGFFISGLQGIVACLTFSPLTVRLSVYTLKETLFTNHKIGRSFSQVIDR